MQTNTVKVLIEMPEGLFRAVQQRDIRNGSIAAKMVLNKVAEGKIYEGDKDDKRGSNRDYKA